MEKVRVKMFDGHHDISDVINKWISENDIRVIDIKFSSCCSDEARRIYVNAMVIYEDLTI